MRRREALGLGAAAVAGLALAGCGGGSAGGPSSRGSLTGAGSTLAGRWGDPGGTGQLSRVAGEALIDRRDLGSAAPAVRELARLVHLTDAHVMDAASPARVPFLARLGPPVQSTFRPHETLTAQVLAGATTAIRAFGPDAVIQGGDLIDNDQLNELELALAVLGGGRVRPGSGPHGYFGVQNADDPDPFYYRPDVDAPRHPGLLSAAVAPFRSPGAGTRVLPVLGDHDVLVAGELLPSALTQGLAVGDRALWELPPGLKLPAGLRLTPGGSPDGPPDPSFVSDFLAQALAGPTVTVPADPRRRQLGVTEAVTRLAAAARASGARTPGATADRLDYVEDLGDRVRLIVLDLARRDGGSGGAVSAGQAAFVADALAGASRRWVLFISHQPLEGSTGAAAVIAELDRSPRVLATLAGHIHRNEIRARPTAAGGYWQITTASLIDFPQQCRALRVLETAGGGVALETWMLDHAGPERLGPVSRELAYLDAAGGRPRGFAGTHADRNVRLHRRAG